MARFLRGKGFLRRNFGRLKEAVSLPDLIEIQSKSFNDFVQLDCLPSERRMVGLEKVFRDIFPIEHNDRISLEYISYELGNWACACGHLTGLENRYRWSCSGCKKSGVDRLDEHGTCPKCKKDLATYIHCEKCLSRVAVVVDMSAEVCRYSGKTYSMPLKVKVQLTSWDIDPKTEKQVVRDIKEQEVFFCDMPVMVDLHEQNNRFVLGNRGTFLINGVDRVVVSQIHRSPGVVFTLSRKTKDFRGNPYHVARIIPARGSWLDFEFDNSDLLWVRIDKKKKVLATTFMQALGMVREKILPYFYNYEDIEVARGGFSKKVSEQLLGSRLEAGSLEQDQASDFIIGQRITKDVLAKLKKKNITTLTVRMASLVNRVLMEDVIDPQTGEILAQQGQALTEGMLQAIAGCKGVLLRVIQSSGYVFQPTIALTLSHDNTTTKQAAIKDVYSKLRPGDVSDPEAMEEYLENLFFNPRFYDLSQLGRIRTNRKLSMSVDESITHLTMDDILTTVKYLVHLKERGEGELDDIDHLGNRCVRLVGELLQSQVYVGFSRIERIVRERFRLQEHHATHMPYDFLNVKPLSAVLREFFGTGQLSQFMDQTNPLSEIAHKRRLSALGPGGISRDRATFEVRDVHTSHYGRICPIETPEGQNIGLISSLSTYARVDDLGFVQATYRPVIEGKVQDTVVCLNAFQEEGECIAQATIPVNSKGSLVEGQVLVRQNGNIVSVDSNKVSYVDASPKQLFSVATALIPFLEHDDVSRALMGSNMQRQAVPLVKAQAPLVGTGIECELGRLEGGVLTAKNDGVVEYVSADKIVIRLNQDQYSDRDWFSHPVDIYYLKKFGRSNHNTWIHYAPLVTVGERIMRGDVLTDGPAVNNGELALGSNVLVAYMPWCGYNFEDAIVLSKRLVANDVYTSVHVEEFSVEARDTKLGPEEITRDIPNVGEKALEALDEDGIVRVGTRVKPGDILVGKVTLKGDVQYSPEEKLLRAIFGEKSREVRDTSLRVPPGIEATVVDVKVFSRSGIRKDTRYKEMVRIEAAKIEHDFGHYVQVLNQGAKDKIVALLVDAKLGTKASFEKKTIEELFTLKVKDKELADSIAKYQEMVSNQIHVLVAQKEQQINRLKKGDDLPSGVIKMVRVYLAMKRHVSVGDKMAGRHGNKGVVSRIVAPEDMPYMEDGTPVDIVLNPLGVPGRMNVGQIMESVLGMIGKTYGDNLAQKIAHESEAQAVKYLNECYGKEIVQDLELNYGKEALLTLARESAKTGVAMQTPIFDGARYEEDIRPLLNELGLPTRGNYKMFDGRTGESFEQPVTIGYIYIMKLNHLADDKLHARSVGPYSLITQQPLGGKAQFGGQRLGEMEVWALYAYGAAYTLQEMLTVKSDDVHGRVKVYESIVRGDEVSEPGVPESFNVLVKELQSLGLQVDLFKTSKEQVGD